MKQPVPNHDQSPPTPDEVFFGGQRREITGRVRSATTTRRTRQSWLERLRPRCSGALVGGFLGLFPVALLIIVADELGWQLSPVVLAGVAALCAGIGAAISPPVDHCSYVGDEGVVHHSLKRDRITTSVFRFEDADRVDPKITHRYTNGFYQGTDMVVTWYVGDEAVFWITSGIYHKDKTPPTSCLVHFCRVALSAWHDHAARARSRLSRRAA